MSDNNLDEFDDLDDYLEDPRKLDEAEEGKPYDAEEKVSNVKKEFEGSDDPEVLEMIEDLQNQFKKLMQQEGDDADQEMVQNFETLLNVLGDASKEKNNQSVKEMKKQMQSGDGFKNIVSNTLDRLKENSTKVDETLEQEKKSQNSDDILSQLLDQLVENGDGDGEDGEGMDLSLIHI